MVGIAHYYMQLNIVYSILLQKENILIFIFFASSTLLLTLVFFFSNLLTFHGNRSFYFGVIRVLYNFHRQI